MSPEQCRAARKRLNWTQETLAAAANVSPSVVADFESEALNADLALLDRVRAALEEVGVGFSFELSAGKARPAGITFSPPDRSETIGHFEQ